MAVVPRSLSKLATALAFSCALGWAQAEDVRFDDHGRVGLVAHIEAHTPQELASILTRAEAVLEAEENYSNARPIALILHGDETQAFLKGNYEAYRELVDMAARLDAFNVIDVQVCETWMRDNGVSREQLPPFVNTVPYGPAVEQELLKQGYEHF